MKLRSWNLSGWWGKRQKVKIRIDTSLQQINNFVNDCVEYLWGECWYPNRPKFMENKLWYGEHIVSKRAKNRNRNRLISTKSQQFSNGFLSCFQGQWWYLKEPEMMQNEG